METQKWHDFLLFFLIYLVSYLSFYFSNAHTSVKSLAMAGRQCNIICYTFMSPGEFCFLHPYRSLHTQLCQTVSCIKLHMRHTHNHKCANSKENVGSSLNVHTQHIFMKWHFVCMCETGLSLASGLPLWLPSGLSLCLPLSPPLPAGRSPSVVSFSLFLTSFCLLSRWYISCSWHGSCIAYG